MLYFIDLKNNIKYYNTYNLIILSIILKAIILKAMAASKIL